MVCVMVFGDEKLKFAVITVPAGKRERLNAVRFGYFRYILLRYMLHHLMYSGTVDEWLKK